MKFSSPYFSITPSPSETQMIHQLGVLQFHSVLHSLETASDPTGDSLSPLRLPSTPDANCVSRLSPVLLANGL